MKTISLRQFRDSIAEIREVVQVVKRVDDGLIVLGVWRPDADDAAVLRSIAGFGTSQPAPKPGGKR